MDWFKASSGPTVETRITQVDSDVREKTGEGGVCVSNQVIILLGPWCRRWNKPILQSSDLRRHGGQDPGGQRWSLYHSGAITGLRHTVGLRKLLLQDSCPRVPTREERYVLDSDNNSQESQVPFLHGHQHPRPETSNGTATHRPRDTSSSSINSLYSDVEMASNSLHGANFAHLTFALLSMQTSGKGAVFANL